MHLNHTLDPDLAEAIALDYGCELDIKRPLDAEEQLLTVSNNRMLPRTWCPALRS